MSHEAIKRWVRGLAPQQWTVMVRLADGQWLIDGLVAGEGFEPSTSWL
jgi:hypothetical protein